VQLEVATVASILTTIVPPRRCGGARKADPTRQPPGACTQASATAGSAPARHDSGPRGVADGAESAPEARPAAGWSPRALSGCRHGHLRSNCARCASRWPGAAARALCRCLLSLDGSARTRLVDTRNQQMPVSELLCRVGASIADGGAPGLALSHAVARHRARSRSPPLLPAQVRLCPGGHSSSTSRLRGVRTTATGAPSHITPLAHVHPRMHSLTARATA